MEVPRALRRAVLLTSQERRPCQRAGRPSVEEPATPFAHEVPNDGAMHPDEGLEGLGHVGSFQPEPADLAGSLSIQRSSLEDVPIAESSTSSNEVHPHPPME